MKLGLNVRNFGPSADPAGLLRWARFAEDTGFSLAMVSDHVAATPDVSAIYPAPFYDPFSILTWLAGQTERIELGTSVTVLPYRSPLLTARIGANVDQFSGGRFILGVGSGWSEPEFTALGIPYQHRGRMTDEYLAAITALWTGPIASYDGEFVSFQDVSTGPSGVRPPHPPIWVGGSAPAAIRRAVRYSDAWHPINVPLGWLRDKGLPALRRFADELGRPVPALCPRIQLRITSDEVTASDRPAGEGTVSQILGDLEEFDRLGSEYLVLDTNPDDPHDERPLDVDFDILRTIVDRI
jgi:probable F420-dependent oxidoreductase